MSDAPPAWILPVMRFGYATRGVTYALVGTLALLAAWTGGRAEGTTDALGQLRDQPWGTPALWIVALGLLAYGTWRFVAAWYDIDDHGTGAKGILARSFLVAKGLIQFGLAFAALRMALGSGSGSGGGTESLASKLMALPFGHMAVMGIGAVVVGAGLYLGHVGWTRAYEDHLESTEVTRRLAPALQAGQIAHGLVILLIGAFLFYAGWATAPGEAGGMSEAFAFVRAQPYGRVLLALLAAGLLCFSLYCFVAAVYRVVPRCAGPGLKSLSGHVFRQVQPG